MTRIVLERPAGRLTVNTYGDPASELAPILFIHPINLRGAAWAHVVPAFAADRFCIVPDMRGFGDSDAASEYAAHLWVEDCLAAVDAAGVERFHIVGGSLGGPLATFIASVVPDRVISLMAFGSQLFSANREAVAVISSLETMTVPEMFSEVIPKSSLGPYASRQVIDETLATTNPNGPDDVRRVWLAAGATDVRSHAKNVICPATIVTGEHDVTCTPEAGAYMAEQLGAPHVIVPGIGHLPMLEAPADVIALLTQHLARVEVNAG
ncbi:MULTISPECIES: alpha/beta hydrolase [unclassified Microbacterium]|uniref:alpha/beta fold hydrolase n=1 Tax=unclassified Microbacterium TaxID=2609290 RepID=UPI00214AA2F3|nr:MULTISPECIES: alpha/beta hydrolase [unclassified Microbacterium]MCR2810627.1 alpha/beta hydrolase [Microbacterium sp. zg.B185]WIM18164.1 alpha/beta hydrolase [Microbacterium sp. zg-B185]